jgi:hypothetical protein
MENLSFNYRFASLSKKRLFYLNQSGHLEGGSKLISALLENTFPPPPGVNFSMSLFPEFATYRLLALSKAKPAGSSLRGCARCPIR